MPTLTGADWSAILLTLELAAVSTAAIRTYLRDSKFMSGRAQVGW